MCDTWRSLGAAAPQSVRSVRPGEAIDRQLSKPWRPGGEVVSSEAGPCVPPEYPPEMPVLIASLSQIIATLLLHLVHT